MTPDPASDPRRAFTLGTMLDDLRESLLSLADQYEAQTEAEAGQDGLSAQGRSTRDTD